MLKMLKIMSVSKMAGVLHAMFMELSGLPAWAGIPAQAEDEDVAARLWTALEELGSAAVGAAPGNSGRRLTQDRHVPQDVRSLRTILRSALTSSGSRASSR
jgi:hypothetical protein